MFQLSTDNVAEDEIAAFEPLTSLFFVLVVQNESSGIPAGKISGR